MRAASLLDVSRDGMAYVPDNPNPLARPAETPDAPAAHTPVAALTRVKAHATPRGSVGAKTPVMALLAAFVRDRLTGWIMAVVSIGSVLLAWHLATHYRLDFYVRFGNIPSPAEVFEKVIEVNQSTAFVTNIGISVRRILYGFAIAGVLGIGLGLLIGRYRWFRQISMPALEVFRPIPAIAWVPMSIMLWPSNEVSIVFITFLGAFFPILLNSIHGVEAIDPVLLRAARSLISYPEIALGMITIGILGLLCSSAIRLTSRLAMPWQASVSPGGRS